MTLEELAGWHEEQSHDTEKTDEERSFHTKAMLLLLRINRHVKNLSEILEGNPVLDEALGTTTQVDSDDN